MIVKTVIIELGFIRSDAEPCLFYKKSNSTILMIALYVDDMLVIGYTESEVMYIQTE